ncbi:MAG TPA: GIY-YIG nuclease family protein [Sphingobacteriaceae bacterium]|nr:GIY-YIG nuclease family protein [Sphingobacteriaceae bacterium]
MQSEFIDLGFDKYLYAKDRLSLADCFTKNNRRGIYILHFQNGEYYVGLAIDVVNRHAQHRLNHFDIEYISFKEVITDNLTEVEKQTVYTLENLQKPLRNINLVSIITGDTDLDLVVSREEQQQWSNYELGVESLKTDRFNYPELRRKYSAKFTKLRKSEYFTLLCEILQNFVLFTIPFPCKTEYSFWSCSCLPAGRNKVFSRVNIFWQEVLTIYEDDFVMLEDKKTFKDLAVSIHLCKSKLFEHHSANELKDKYPSLELTDHFYDPGGQDQQNIIIGGVEFLNLLNDATILDAIKEFNLRLMRKGGCIFNRYHCFDLADEALRMDNLEFDN